MDGPMNTDIPAISPNPAPLATPADREHLKLLAVFHFVLAGFMAFFSCFGLIYVALGFAMATGRIEGQNGPPPELGWIFAGLGAIGVTVGWTIAGLIVLAGRRLLQHRSRVFCMIVAAVMCLSIPFGTILGVFTLIVLARPSVRHLFGET
jgi:hypothetical protein